jgi:hypothetical protein
MAGQYLDYLQIGQYYSEDWLKRTGVLTSYAVQSLYNFRYVPDKTPADDDVETLRDDDTSAVFEVVSNLLGSLRPSVNPLGGLDVKNQDQYTRLIDRFLTRVLGSVTVAADISFNDRTVTLAPGHGFTNAPAFGEMLELEYNGVQYQSRVLSVVGDVISVTNPFCCNIPAGTVGSRTSPDANVDGSVAPIIFETKPPDGVLWDINILSINMLDATVMDDAKFGGIDGPIDGVVYRTVNDTQAENIFTAVDNSCFIRHCDGENPYSEKAPSGQYGFNTKRRFNGQQGDGVSRRIGGGFHSFQVIIYADITGLNRFWNVIRGHEVD